MKWTSIKKARLWQNKFIFEKLYGNKTMGIEEFYKFLAEHKPEELLNIIEAKNKQVE